jgi:Putative  PD-(D/E)XK family member, (DUF4420)
MTSKVENIDAAVWAALRDDPAKDGSVTRRVLPNLRHDVFIGEHRPGRERFLWLDIKEPGATLPPKRPSSRGLSVEVDDSVTDIVSIRLTASTAGAEPLFTDLADNVVGVLAHDPGQGAAARVLGRIISWQEFFSVRRHEFSAETAAGLFAELTILASHMIPTYGPLTAIEAWHGPDPALQDFQYRTIAIEVKSSRETGPGELHISSERQLDPVPTTGLFVAYVRLDQRAEGAGVSLAEKIADIYGMVNADYGATTEFDDRLLTYGWHDTFAEHRTEKYVVRSVELFEVTNGFPSIVPSDLRDGVHGVSYSIDRTAIEGFLTEWAGVVARAEQELG